MHQAVKGQTPLGESSSFCICSGCFAAIHALVTHITAIEEIAGVTTLCSSTLTTNKLIIDRDTIKTYAASLLTMLSLSRHMHPTPRTRTPSMLPLLVLFMIWAMLTPVSSALIQSFQRHQQMY